MKPSVRQQLMWLHVLLAAFLLPVAILYFISGALYTLDIKGTVSKQVFPLKLEQSFTPDLARLEDITNKALGEKKLPIPDGEPSLRKKKGRYQLRWSDRTYIVTLVPGKGRHRATLTFKKRSLLTRIMRIHRAESGTLFKIFAVALVAGLILIFSSGILMAQAISKLRRPLLIAVASGLLSFLILVWF